MQALNTHAYPFLQTWVGGLGFRGLQPLQCCSGVGLVYTLGHNSEILSASMILLGHPGEVRESVAA